MSEPIRLVLMQGRPIFREALARMLRREEIEVVDLPREPPRGPQGHPDVVLIDATEEKSSAVDLTRWIRGSFPGAKLIALGLDPVDAEILRFVEAGAAGYLLKESSFDDLLATLKAVMRGEAPCPARLVRSVLARIQELQRSRPRLRTPVLLTARELEVLRLIAAGLSNKEIARQLGIALYTVKNHLHRTLEKLEVHHRRDAVRAGYELGLLRRR